jgi:hypothetical protein
MLKVFAGSLILLSIASLAIGAELYIPRQVDGQIVTHQPDLSPNPKPEPLRAMISQKNILGLQRAQPYGLPVSKFGYPLIAGVQDIDTINVLVLKVEFEPEDPDDPTTTGNGTFDLRTQAEFIADEGHDFDPAPHNSVYFNAHMEFRIINCA